MNSINVKSTLTLLVAVLLSSAVFAQDYAFMVLGAKGDNKVDGSALKVGTSLKATQTLEVGEGAYLGLAHQSGKTLEIKQNGTYKVADLETKLEKLSSDMGNEIAMYIIDELTSDDNKSNRFSHSMVKTGSVTRATPSQSPLQIMLPSQSEFVPGEVTIRWYLDDESIEAPEKYTFVALNLRGIEVIRKEVSGNSVTLDLSELDPFDMKLLKYQVIANDDLKSEEQGLKLPKRNADELTKELGKFSSEDTPINHYLRAEFFAKNGLLANAMNSYEAAGEAFEDSYQEFLKAFKLTKASRVTNGDETEDAGE